MKQTPNLDRRSFLKGAAATAAGAAALGLAGCAGQTTETPGATAADAAETQPANTGEQTNWDFETEVLVVGFGGAGSVAAVTAHEAGAEVLILEKAAHSGGGNSSVSGANICTILDVDKAVEYMSEGCQGTTPESVLRAWAEEGATTLEWLDERDIGYTDRESSVGFKGLPHGDDEIARTIILSDPDDKNHAGGNYFIEWARQYMDDNGIEVKFDMRATDLVQDPITKEVLGVKAQNGDAEVAIRATKGVVLATGGFEANEEMVANYVRPCPLKPTGWPLNTGDGHKMAQAIGADFWHMSNVAGSGYVFDEPDSIVGRTSFKNWVPNSAFIFVNRNGERFQCEHPSTYWSHISTLSYAFHDETRSQPTTAYRDIPFYVVFDETLRSAGCLFPDTGKLAGLPLVPADLGGQQHTWSEDNLEEVEMGWILKADTLEELAEAINAHAADDRFAMTGESLAETVARYNGFCEAGADDDFGRPAAIGEKQNLIALNNPPYYAMRFMPCIISTCGGPAKNEKGQILDVKGQVIPRLYGAGVISHVAGFTYPFSGLNWSEVFNGGRIAGRNAAAESSVS